MRLLELTILNLIGALSLGAYFVGKDWIANWLLAGPGDRAFDHPYYTVVHSVFMTRFATAVATVAAGFIFILCVGSTRLRAITSVVVAIWGVAVSLTFLPTHLLNMAALQRRYGELQDAMDIWSNVSSLTRPIVLLAFVILLVLLLIAIFQSLRRWRAAE